MRTKRALPSGLKLANAGARLLLPLASREPVLLGVRRAMAVLQRLQGRGVCNTTLKCEHSDPQHQPGSPAHRYLAESFDHPDSPSSVKRHTYKPRRQPHCSITHH